GLLEVLGLGLWGAHVWGVMAGRVHEGPAPVPPVAYRPGEPVEAGHRVGEVLDHNPGLLETFVALGFRPLANPLLRRTLARRVTIGRACRLLGLEAEGVLVALNRGRRPGDVGSRTEGGAPGEALGKTSW